MWRLRYALLYVHLLLEAFGRIRTGLLGTWWRWPLRNNGSIFCARSADRRHRRIWKESWICARTNTRARRWWEREHVGHPVRLECNLELILKQSGEFKMTHQATANRWSLSAHMVSGVAARFCYFGRMNVRTDTMCENDDHLFGRGGSNIIHNNLFNSYYHIFSWIIVTD